MKKYLSILCMSLLIFMNVSLAQAANVYDRIMEKGVIECGYFVEPPFTMKNEVTGEFSGISVDLIEMIAKDLNLKVKWKEQISFATFPEDLNNNKYDLVCGGIFVLSRGGRMDYTRTYAYASMMGYVRGDNSNFDKPFDEIDWRGVKIAGLDGEGATTAAQKLLPEADMKILPQLSNISEMLLNVATRKADIGFVLPSVFQNFDKTNPGKLKAAKLRRALYTYDVSFGIARDQYELKSLIDNAIRQYTVSGELAALFKKYDPNQFFEYPVVNKEP